MSSAPRGSRSALAGATPRAVEPGDACLVCRAELRADAVVCAGCGGGFLFIRREYKRKGRRRTVEDGFRSLPDPAPAVAALREAARGAGSHT